MNSQFETYFVDYLTQAKQARDRNQHHDFRRQLFLAFLTGAFGIEAADIEVEKYIHIANEQVPVKGIARIRKGWIDAVFRDLIFEFKRYLKKEEAEGLRELCDYLSTITNGAECIGLLTDGLVFTAYVLDVGQPHNLRKIDSINLETTTPHLAYLWLDAYLLRQSNMPPTSADIVRRFGLLSPTFVAAARPLREALKVFGTSETGALEVKRQQWAFHLARVYGNADISNDEMFVRHTYLCQFAKVLAYTSYFGVSEATRQIEGIISGRAFQVLGVSNIGEQDFFAWVLAPQVCVQTIDIFRRIAESLVVYDLKQIDEDLLKQLYQNLVEPETRHELGEFYTPDWLAELTLREIQYGPDQSLLDPACGSGTFLFTAIRRLCEQGLVGQKLVDFALENIMGMDVHPLAVTIAKINYMLAILPHLQSGAGRKLRTIPISMAYVLQNTSRPLILSYRKFDVVAGNPPWISYRYIQDETYQAEIKKLAREYGLLAPNEMKLHTQMELATVFFEHCRHRYLKINGTIAFVMPRSVITGAKQHRAFQQRGFSHILDFKDVAPLFNVETCVMVCQDEAISTQTIPTKLFAGVLPAHECTWVEASPRLTRVETSFDFVKQEEIASPYYYPRFKQGATLVPRNLAFVSSAQPNLAPGHVAFTPIMQTDPDVNEEAKAPWKGVSHTGHIDEDFLYATLLSKQLLPFSIGRLHLVALPVRVATPRQLTTLPGREQEERFVALSLEEMREDHNFARSADEWFAYVEQLWQQKKKDTTRETLAQWFNYQNKLTSQSATPGYLVLYAAAGSNLAASVIDTSALPIINGAQPKAFVVDHTTYWYRCVSKDEGYFLTALLNAPCVDRAIKAHQTRGLFGARHIHRRPFEVCAIPAFNPHNPDHLQLASLSQAAHLAVSTIDFSKLGVVAARKQARQVAHLYIEQIDEIAQRMLGLMPASTASQEAQYEEGMKKIIQHR